MTKEPKHEGSGPALESLFNLAAARASADAQPISPEEGTRRAMRYAAEAMKETVDLGEIESLRAVGKAYVAGLTPDQRDLILDGLLCFREGDSFSPAGFAWIGMSIRCVLSRRQDARPDRRCARARDRRAPWR